MLALFERYTFSKFHCVVENSVSVGGNQTKIGLMQKWKMILIKWIDQLIFSRSMVTSLYERKILDRQGATYRLVSIKA